MIHIYNSLTAQKEELKPVKPGQVGMYVCGPTVYDFPHIGNARPVVIFDVLYRMLCRIYGRDHVTYVRNITDVDDKINEAARKNGEPISVLTSRVTAEFHRDMEALGNLQPTYEPRATEHIPEMIDVIERLIQNNHAYISEGHVLFSVKTDPEYGLLSRRKLEDLIAGARVVVERYKRDSGDFVLWKPADADDDSSSIFDSPWGRGRPGWHIECSAMSAKYLSHDFDIHGGGADLKFPHHENEIAQSTCAHKGSRYAKYWMHNGFVTVNGEKMAKSVGNFITVRDLLSTWPGEVIRLLLLKTHYRAPLDFTVEGLREAKAELDSWYRVAAELPDHSGGSIWDDMQANKWGNAETPTLVLVGKFGAALKDDLNTPGAIAALRELKARAAHGSVAAVGALRRAANVLGLMTHSKDEWFQGRITLSAADATSATAIEDVTAIQIEALIEQRQAAKQAKNFAESDRIRDELAAGGIVLEDGPKGTTWRRR